MAIVHINGFGTIPVTGDAVSLLAAASGVNTYSRQAGRYGGYALRNTNSNANTGENYSGKLRLPTGYSDFSVGFAVNHRAVTGTVDHRAFGFWWEASNSYGWGIGFGTGLANSYGSPAAGASGWTVVDGTPAGVGWHWYNIIFRYNATAGLGQVFRDGNLLATVGPDTVPTVPFSSAWSRCDLNFGNANGGYQADIGDLVFRNDNVVIPDTVVASLFPDGNSASSWVGSDSNSIDNYQLVNENPTYNSANYVGSGTLNAADIYTMSNLPNTANSVHAVQVSARAFKNDAGARSFALTLNGATGTSRDPGTGQTIYELVTTNPAGGAAWDTVSVNNMSAGVVMTT